MRSTYFAIESEMTGPVWFSAAADMWQWTHDIHAAIQFRRAQDAAVVARALHLGADVNVTEHEDVDLPELQS